MAKGTKRTKKNSKNDDPKNDQSDEDKLLESEEEEYIPKVHGAIVGYRTKKLLHISVKNEFCLVCSKGGTEGHERFKNWASNESSLSMEAAAIVEGFRKSEEQPRLRFMRVIADGDASVYNRILTAWPYGHGRVVKIECTNHLLRCFSRKLKTIAEQSSSRNRELKELRQTVANNISKFRRLIIAFVKKYHCRGVTEANITLLESEIRALLDRVFGDDSRNILPLLKKYKLDEDINTAIGYLARNSSRSLKYFEYENVNAPNIKFDSNEIVIEPEPVATSTPDKSNNEVFDGAGPSNAVYHVEPVKFTKSDIRKNTFVVARYKFLINNKKEASRLYVGYVEEIFLNKVLLRFLRPYENRSKDFHFPLKDDCDYVKFENICNILPEPVEKRGIYSFPEPCI